MGGRKAPSQRQLRVGEEVRHVLAEVLARHELRDPALANVSITVSEVRVSPNLGDAKVFVVPFGTVEAAPVLAGLGRAASFLSTRVAAALSLRRSPRLHFVHDTSFDQAGHLDRLIGTLPPTGADSPPEEE